MLQAIVIFVKYFNIILGLIKAAEVAFPDAGFGSFKLAFVREVLEKLDDGVGKVWPAIADLIGVIVAQFNAAKVFTTSGTVATPTAPGNG